MLGARLGRHGSGMLNRTPLKERRDASGVDEKLSNAVDRDTDLGIFRRAITKVERLLLPSAVC